MSLQTAFIVVNVPGLKPGDRWAGCRRLYATRAGAEAVAGDKLGVSRWVAEVWGERYPILGGGPEALHANGWNTETRFIIAG